MSQILIVWLRHCVGFPLFWSYKGPVNLGKVSERQKIRQNKKNSFALFVARYTYTLLFWFAHPLHIPWTWTFFCRESWFRNICQQTKEPASKPVSGNSQSCPILLRSPVVFLWGKLRALKCGEFWIPFTKAHAWKLLINLYCQCCAIQLHTGFFDKNRRLWLTLSNCRRIYRVKDVPSAQLQGEYYFLYTSAFCGKKSLR